MRDVHSLVQKYYTSRFFTRISVKTQGDYTHFLRGVCDTDINGSPLGECLVRNVTKAIAETAYSQWVDRGPFAAEHMRSACRRLWNLGDRWDWVHTNPWKSIEPEKLPERKVVWTQDQIRAFLDTAFAKPEWGNIGVIVLLAYELGQRLVDMRNLEWNEYNEDDGIVQFTQTKRGVDMDLPINDTLKVVLKQQRDIYGDGIYLCPYHKTKEPYTQTLLSKTGRRICDAAGLPNTLRLMDMRRTAVTEAADGGATLSQIMAMTGHQNTESVKPYLRKSRVQAAAAIDSRGTRLTTEDIFNA